MDRFDGSYVLAGFDGSPPSDRALRWAVDEARLRRMPLTVCHAWHWAYPVPPSGPQAVDTARKMARHTLERGVLMAREASPRTPVRGLLVYGPALATLVNQSKNASLAVVGTHGEWAFTDPARASPAGRLPSYAHCPVVVVRGAPERSRPVVVGVDGSSTSDAVLAFGFEEAALRGLALRAVYGCWEPEAIASAELGMITGPEDVRTLAAGRLERTLSPWREKYPYVDADTVLSLCTPRHALLEAAARAALVVVGGRELGGADDMRLGPVSTAVLQRAPCPVAVVRPWN
jgi:nucleotide-binding universal stress UspA family protein